MGNLNILTATFYSVFAAFVIALVLGPVFIPMLHNLKFGQFIREEGPKSHQKKSGTPTIGGIIFLVAILVSSLILSKFNSTLAALIFITFGFGLIGFLDDYIKVAKKRNLGLTPSQKIIGQFIVATVFAFFIVNSMKYGTTTYVPFMKKFIDLKWGFIPFIIFVIIGTVNSVNLTDGIDGLASSVTVVVMIFFIIIAIGFSPVIKANGAAIIDEKNLSIFSGAVLGSLMGFLVFNCNPAKVFMGDTGSLALGGAVVGLAVLLKVPIILIIIGFVYMMESLSVIIQVTSFKTTGKRVFKMSPIHHHFEMCGWSETKIVTVFSIVTAVLCMIGLLAI